MRWAIKLIRFVKPSRPTLEIVVDIDIHSKEATAITRPAKRGVDMGVELVAREILCQP